MDSLTSVSETALITLRARVVEANRENPMIRDEIAVKALDRLLNLLPAETRPRILRRALPSTATRYIALKSRKYDLYVGDLLKHYPDGLVVSLGCGFDTRYWRVSTTHWNYVEVDLPEVIEAKRQVLADIVNYPMIGNSVLDATWIGTIQSMAKERVLFLAEGLFMYLPKNEVVRVFKRLSEEFSDSQIVFEVVHEDTQKGYGRRLWHQR